MSIHETPDAADAAESGFGLVEIVVSMFLFGLLAIALLPLLIQSLQISVTNATTATATQLVNKQMELARAAGSTCVLLTAFDAAVPLVVNDARGDLQQQFDAPCTSGQTYPRTITATMKVTRSGQTLAEAVTLIFLKSA